MPTQLIHIAVTAPTATQALEEAERVRACVAIGLEFYVPQIEGAQVVIEKLVRAASPTGSSNEPHLARSRACSFTPHTELKVADLLTFARSLKGNVSINDKKDISLYVEDEDLVIVNNQ